MEAVRLQTQLAKWKMDHAADDLAKALTTVLTQVRDQAAQRMGESQVHHTCLGNIRLGSDAFANSPKALRMAEAFANSPKALRMAEAALIAQRERETEQYPQLAHLQLTQSLYQKTSDRWQLLRKYSIGQIKEAYP